MSRISREARSVGTVPVALATNPFAEIDDWGDGIVLVPDVESLANEVRSLLGDPALINSLAVAARRGARAQADWDAYRSRLAGALEQVAAVRPEDEARAEIGALLRGSFASLRDEFASAREEFASAREEFEAILATNLVEIEKTSTELKRVCRELGRANGDLERTGAELSRVSGELARVKGEYASARLDSARELAAARSQADDLGSALAVAESELAAFRSRLLVRIVEQSGYGKLVGARRARQRSPEN
jgi:chromosome segregation ATPase